MTVDPNFNRRMKVGGDLAEGAFKKYAQQHSINYERYGFDRSNLDYFNRLPEFVRVTPDFACTSKQKPEGFLVECKGCGRGDVVKIKNRDLVALQRWAEHVRTLIFIYDSSTEQVAFFDCDEINSELWAQFQEYPQGQWPDGTTYYEVPKTMFTWVKL